MNKYYVKRFNPQISDKTIEFIPMEKEIKLALVSIDFLPQLEIKYTKKDPKAVFTEILNISEFIDVQGIKAKGKRLNLGDIKSVKWLDPLPYDEIEEPEEEEIEDDTPSDGSLEGIAQAEAEAVFETIDKERPRYNFKRKPEKPAPEPTLFDQGEQ